MTDTVKTAILVVEDDEMFTTQVRRALEDEFADTTILSATNAADATKTIRNNPVKLVITDMNYPYFPDETRTHRDAGLHLIRRSERDKPTIKYIAMSSEFSDDARKYCAMFGIPAIDKDYSGRFTTKIIEETKKALADTDPAPVVPERQKQPDVRAAKENTKA